MYRVHEILQLQFSFSNYSWKKTWKSYIVKWGKYDFFWFIPASFMRSCFNSFDCFCFLSIFFALVKCGYFCIAPISGGAFQKVRILLFWLILNSIQTWFAFLLLFCLFSRKWKKEIWMEFGKFGLLFARTFEFDGQICSHATIDLMYVEKEWSVSSFVKSSSISIHLAMFEEHFLLFWERTANFKSKLKLNLNRFLEP